MVAYCLKFVPVATSGDFETDVYQAFHAYASNIEIDAFYVWCWVNQNMRESFEQSIGWLRDDGNQIDLIGMW